MLRPMARLRSGLVVTVSTLAAACGTAEPIRGNPPAPVRNPPEQPQPPPLAEGSVVNPRDGDGRPIYRNAARCYVELPFDEPPTAVVPPPTKEVPCPAEMTSDPAWAECAGGAVVLSKVGPPPSCKCMVMGNPPPPERDVACPADVAARAGGSTP